MAEHERTGQKKPDEVDQKRRNRQVESQPSYGPFHAGEQGTVAATGAPFWPRLEEHAESLATAHSDEQQANLVLHLQQTYGNRYVQRLIESMGVQTKLTVNDPNDIYEQEADRAADTVTRAATSHTQRQEEEEGEEEEEEIQAKPADFLQRQVTNVVPEVSPEIEGKINAARSGGEPLDDNIREPMEQAFGADFGGVRIHSDDSADALSQSLQARAFTTGKDIFFSSGEYDPSSSAGQRLLAHELTHTIQQGASNRIARAETRMVVKKTFLRKPDKYMDSPTKRRLKPALTPSDAVEMLDQKSPSAENPKWQMVRDPKTGNLGFVRLSKVADIKAPSRPGIVEVKGVADIIKALVGLFGGASTVAGLEKNRKDGLTAFGKKLWEENPDLVKRLVQVNDPTNDEETTKAGVEALEQQYPVLKDIEATTKGLVFGGLGVGMAGEALGGIGGLIGMVQGIKNFYGPEATSKDKWEAALATGKGGASIATGILGVGEKGLKIGKELVGGKTPGGIVLNTIAGFVGMISGVVKTVKGGVDTVVAFFKGAAVIVKKLKKGTETKTREVFGAINEFFSSFAGMLKGALKTAGGAVKMLQAALPTISKVAGPIMGLVGSVINLVTAGCGAIKNSISLIGWIKGLRKNNETIKKLEDKEHIRTERNMGDKLRRLMGRPSMALKLTKQGKPDPGQMEKAMSKYEKKKGRARSKRTEQDYSDVKQYRLDRDIVDNLGKRITRSLSRIPEFVLDGLADAISILGAIVSVVADIGFIATAGTGIGAAIFATTKVVSSIVTGVLSGLLRLGKVVYSVGRGVVRAIKKRLPGGKKREAAKHEKRKWDTIALMQMVSGLPELDPSDDEAKAAYDRTELRLGAAGVDLKKLYGKNDKPAEQAKMIYKAMAKRE